jgi:hypothetical protein
MGRAGRCHFWADVTGTATADDIAKHAATSVDDARRIFTEIFPFEFFPQPVARTTLACLPSTKPGVIDAPVRNRPMLPSFSTKSCLQA